MLYYVIMLEVVVRRFDLLHVFLLSSHFCSPGSFRSLKKITGVDHDAHQVRHGAACGGTVSSCGQLRPWRRRATSKKSPGEVDDEEEEEEKNSTPGLPRVLMHQAWHRLQPVGSDVNYAA